MDYFSGEDKDVHTPEDLIEVATNAGMTNEEVLLVFCSLYVAMHHCRPPFDLHSGQIIVTSGALNCNTIINAAQSNSYNS